MKYLLMIYGNQEKWASIPAEDWPEAIARQDAFNRKYQETGELLGAYGLADAAAARLVRREGGMPAVTDGPYLETKEYLASFYLLDCESEERALQIAADMPWADVEPVEFWPILHEAERRSCDRPARDVEDLLRELAPQVLAARWCAGTGSSTCARTPARRRCSRRRCGGPTDGIPENPRGWLITVGSRRLMDQVRSEQSRRNREDADRRRRPRNRNCSGRRPTP